MSEDWMRMQTKAIKESTLGDFVKAGGHRFHHIQDNGKQAAERMMKLL